MIAGVADPVTCSLSYDDAASEGSKTYLQKYDAASQSWKDTTESMSNGAKLRINDKTAAPNNNDYFMGIADQYGDFIVASTLMGVESGKAIKPGTASVDCGTTTNTETKGLRLSYQDKYQVVTTVAATTNTIDLYGTWAQGGGVKSVKTEATLIAALKDAEADSTANTIVIDGEDIELTKDAKIATGDTLVTADGKQLIIDTAGSGITLTVEGTLEVVAGSTLNLEGANSKLKVESTGTVENAGTISNVGAITNIGTINNEGTVTSTGNVTNTGTINASVVAGAKFEQGTSGAFAVNSAGAVTDANDGLKLASGITATFNTTGDIAIADCDITPTFTKVGTCTIKDYDGTDNLTVTAGTLNVNELLDATGTGTTTLNTGTSGVINVAGDCKVEGGKTIGGTGGLTVAGAFTVTGTTGVADPATLTLSGTLSSGTTLITAAGGKVDLSGATLPGNTTMAASGNFSLVMPKKVTASGNTLTVTTSGTAREITLTGSDPMPTGTGIASGVATTGTTDGQFVSAADATTGVVTAWTYAAN